MWWVPLYCSPHKCLKWCCVQVEQWEPETLQMFFQLLTAQGFGAWLPHYPCSSAGLLLVLTHSSQ